MAGIEQSLQDRINLAFGQRLAAAEYSLLDGWFTLDSLAHELTSSTCDPVEEMSFNARNGWQYRWDNVQFSSSGGDSVRTFNQRLVIRTDMGVVESYTYFPLAPMPERRVQYFEGRRLPGPSPENDGISRMYTHLRILRHLIEMDGGENLTHTLKNRAKGA